MEGGAKLDYANCVKISTDASIREMIPPDALVMLTPLIVGAFFGVETLAGVLACSLVSGVQDGASKHAKTLGPGLEAHKTAVIGDTIGNPLKDTSTPSLNILIKLMAIESLVFAPFFATHGGFTIQMALTLRLVSVSGSWRRNGTERNGTETRDNELFGLWWTEQRILSPSPGKMCLVVGDRDRK